MSDDRDIGKRRIDDSGEVIARPMMELWIGYYSAPDADEIAAVLSAMSAAFAEFRRENGLSQAHLAIERINIGSISIWLSIAEKLTGTVDLINTAFEHREQLKDFCSDLGIYIAAARDAAPILNRPAAYNLISAIAKPVARRDAGSAKIKMEGNGLTLEISGDVDAVIVETAIRAAFHDGLPDDDDHDVDPMRATPAERATLVAKGGVWYAKPASYPAGTRLPVRADARIDRLDRGKRYTVRGRVVFDDYGETFEPIMSYVKRL